MPKKFLFGALAIVMALMFAGAGCGGSHGEGGPGPEPGKESAQSKGGAITNMCEQFTAAMVSEVLGKTIVKTESQGNPLYCMYYTEYTEDFYKLGNGKVAPGGPWVSLDFENRSVESQKKGNEALGRKIETNSKIPMEHFMTVQEDDGLVNQIYLVLDEAHYVSVGRSSNKVLDTEGMINFAVGIAKSLKKM
ncbi:MAG: hypothetical protein PHD72_04000 [Patescibacteria group bacterium]|nr:hypothetical protein [Patescibacteria group bacterium]